MYKNKVTTYLLYALGEIFLVVIGILIALEVNNWNESRKLKERENLFLKEFIASIEKDLLTYEMQYGPRLSRKQMGIDSLTKYILGGKAINQKEFLNFYSAMKQGIKLAYDNGPYESLKSVSLESVTNETLRSQINMTFTALPLIQSFSHNLDDNTEKRIRELEYKVFIHEVVKNEQGTTNLNYATKVDDVLQNQDFLWIYDFEKNKLYEYISRLEQMKVLMLNLKKQIEIELTNNF